MRKKEQRGCVAGVTGTLFDDDDFVKAEGGNFDDDFVKAEGGNFDDDFVKAEGGN